MLNVSTSVSPRIFATTIQIVGITLLVSSSCLVLCVILAGWQLDVRLVYMNLDLLVVSIHLEKTFPQRLFLDVNCHAVVCSQR